MFKVLIRFSTIQVRLLRSEPKTHEDVIVLLALDVDSLLVIFFQLFPIWLLRGVRVFMVVIFTVRGSYGSVSAEALHFDIIQVYFFSLKAISI